MIGETGARRDFRQALRALLATRLISAVGVVTLATAIGAVTAVFSLLNSVLLRPLPVHAPDRLMSVSSDFAISHGFTGGAGWSVPMWDRFQPFASRFDGAFAWYTHEFTLGRGIETAPVTGLYVSGEFFSTLGVRAERGRLLGPADDVRGGGPAGVVGVISHRLWRQRFAGTDGPPGTPLIVDGSPVTIVGVMPAEFLGLEVGRRVDVVLPLGAEPALRGRDSELFRPRNFTLLVMLRLKDGQPAATATAMLRQLQPEVVPADAPTFAQEPFTLVPAAGGPSNPGGLRPRYAQPLVTMLAGVGLVLVIACVNIANLQLARVTTRRRDLGIELALGYSARQAGASGDGRKRGALRDGGRCRSGAGDLDRPRDRRADDDPVRRTRSVSGLARPGLHRRRDRRRRGSVGRRACHSRHTDRTGGGPAVRRIG